jgi:hypothetical protein
MKKGKKVLHGGRKQEPDKRNEETKKERESWIGEERKNETSAIKKEKRVLDRGRKQKRDKFRRKEKTIQQQKHTYFIELEIDQDHRDSLGELQPKPELRRSLLKEGRRLA